MRIGQSIVVFAGCTDIAILSNLVDMGMGLMT